MSQLLKLLDNRSSIDGLKPSSRSNSTNQHLNMVSNPHLIEPHTQTTTTTIRPSRPTNKKKSSSKTSTSKSKHRSGSSKNVSGGESSRSQSGCSVCDSEVRRSRSRSGGSKKTITKKPAVFLEKLLDNNNASKNEFNRTKEANVKSRSLLEDSTTASAAQPTLFDKYLVKLIA